MAKLIIQGEKKLYGEIQAPSAKNAILPLLAGSLLTVGETRFVNCPDILDVENMLKILQCLGCECEFCGHEIKVDSSSADNHVIPTELAKQLRSSVFLMGSILGRYKKAVITYPGGCDIGLRPINLHIDGLKALNVKISEEGGYIICDGSKMRGGSVLLDFPSVGATENIMMAAALTKGTTIIKNAAREPEIVDLQNFINKMGGRVHGASKSAIEIQGVEKLSPCVYKPIPDRIVAGTYLIAAAMTAGEITLSNVVPEHIYSLIVKLRESACKIVLNNDKIHIQGVLSPLAIKKVQTSPHPGFPTDMQAQIMAYMSICTGVSIIEENMFETRFRHVSELTKMGADIVTSGKTAIVKGVKKLHGAEVTAHDLRGGASLVLAALSAEGKTIVSDISHIDRGYPEIEKNLRLLGADIVRE